MNERCHYLCKKTTTPYEEKGKHTEGNQDKKKMRGEAYTEKEKEQEEKDR